jgi:WD40 repeat protein
VHDFTNPKGPVIALAISPDGRRVAGGSENSLRVWDVDTGQEAFNLGVPTPGILAFSADGRHLTCACNDGSARSWDADGTQDRYVQVTDRPQAMTLSAHGEWVAAFSADGQVSVWNVPHRTRRTQMKLGIDRPPGLALSADGSRLAVEDGTQVGIYNLEKGGLAQLLPLNEHGVVTAIAISADGRHLATAGIDNKIVNWDTSTGSIANVLPGHQAQISALAYSADTTLLASASSDGELKEWNVRPTRIDVGVQVFAVAMDEERIAVGGADGAVHLFDGYTGSRLGELTRHDNPVATVAFTRDGRRIASGGIDGIRVWDIDSGKQLRVMRPGGGLVTSVEFDPSGRYLASAGQDDTIRIWDTDTGAMVRDMSAQQDGREDRKGLAAMAYSPDGRHIAAGGFGQTVRIWDADTGRQLRNFRVDAAVMSVAFSPGGDVIVAGAWDNTVQMWDANSGAHLRTLSGHQGAVTGVAFTPDGTKIATTGDDGALRLWDTGTGRPFGDPQLLNSGRLVGLAMSRTGRHVVTVGSDRSVAVTLADATPAGLCELLASNMSMAHWREWVSSSIDYVEACPGLPQARDADG